MSFVSDIIGSVIGADSNRHAVNVQTDAANRATDLQGRMYDQTRADNLPALDARNAGLNQLKILLGLGGVQDKPMQRSAAQLRAALAPRYVDNPEGLDAAVKIWQEREAAKVADWTKNGGGQANFGALNQRYTGADLKNDPGYRFGLNQVTNSAQHNAAARGGLFSGATLKALSRYSQDYAGTKFNEGFNRFQAQQDSTFNRLAGLAGIGQTGSNQIAAAGQNYANQAGQNMIGIGNAQAAAGMNQANLIGNGLNSLASWASRRDWGSQQPYNGFMPSPFSGSGTGYGIGGGDGFTTDPYAGF